MQNLLYDVQGSIAIVTINRPDKLNALNRQTLLEIEDAVAGAMADATVHAVILTGSGDKAFAAGADVAEFADYSPTEARDLSETGHRIMDSLAQAPKPILASINGFALGGGLELAMACHLRVASPNARLGQPEVNLGLIPGYGGTQRLVEWVGRARALEMLMNG
ncbi:MAG: enoyl-CoA hydratase/isomerase family protein, partial [Bacteroidota bacterium]